MKKEAITFIGTGDANIDRKEPETVFRHVVDRFRSADITCVAMVQVLSDKGRPTEQAVYASSKIVDAYRLTGVDVVSTGLTMPEIGVWKVFSGP